MGEFWHRKLDVYQRTIEAIRLVARISDAMPAKDEWLARQLRRSAGSVLLNLGEGCGEHSPLEKARILRISRRSAFESAEALQLTRLYGRPNNELVAEAEAAFLAIAEMLTKLSMRFEEQGIRKSTKRRNKQ
jgi:four helix bundle protein